MKEPIWPSVAAAATGFIVINAIGQLIGLPALFTAISLGWIWACIMQIAEINR